MFAGFLMLELFVKDLSVWVPTLELESDIQAWADGGETVLDDGSAPKVASVPPAMRRRLGRLGKISLYVAGELIERNGYMPSIFCSRHGEIQTTIQMLKDLIWNDEISPTKFSLSVHNAISGIFTIANKSDLPTTAITAGEQDLINCFYEAYAQLKTGDAKQVLCVIYDEPIPEEYQRYCPLPPYPYAIGLVLGLEEGIKCSISQVECGGGAIEEGSIGVMALEFVKAMLKKESNTELKINSGETQKTWKVEFENY
ncbi:MAG: hypothetical protein D6B28_03025 [Gammaproteobacteria bacterium]|nr:MAG: hypothetical protein D6B28_03025 [Gammaproteobacteria bacterium]